MTQMEAIKLAIEWIEKQPEETPHSKYDVDTRYVVIRELEAALAQPEQDEVDIRSRLYQRIHELETQLARGGQEPVACDCTNPWAHDQCTEAKGCKIKKKLLRTPPQRKEPEQEPVAWKNNRSERVIGHKPFEILDDWTPLYTTPPQRKPLTRERLVEMAYAQCGLERTFEDWVELFAREIEAAHGIKE